METEGVVEVIRKVTAGICWRKTCILQFQEFHLAEALDYLLTGIFVIQTVFKVTEKYQCKETGCKVGGDAGILS